MNLVNPDFIEKYQLLLEEEPHSKVFAPLAEAYRKMGLYKQAKEICERGIKANPDFASGRVAYAQVLIEQENYRAALAQLKEAIALAPENILAYSLIAQCHLHQKDPKEALKAFKMVLFLNPNHAKAQNAVQKLESLTADEYEEDVFALQKLSDQVLVEKEDLSKYEPLQQKSSDLAQIHRERHLSLIDAFIARSDFAKAQSCLDRAKNEMGDSNDLIKRQKLINKHLDPNATAPAFPLENTGLKPLPSTNGKKKKKIKKLEHLLKNINFNEKI